MPDKSSAGLGIPAPSPSHSKGRDGAAMSQP